MAQLKKYSFDAYKQEFICDNVNYFYKILDMENDKNPDVIIETIKEFVRTEGKPVSTSQLRNIYDVIIDEKNHLKAKFFRPKLAYIAARQNKRGAKEFIMMLDELLKEVNSDSQFRNFKLFFEAIVAYHKYHFNN